MDAGIYDAQADTISVDDIATNSNNRIVLRRIKRNNADERYNELFIQNEHGWNGEGCVDYVPEGAVDMGWLGYFVGKNHHLNKLVIRRFEPTSGASVNDVMEPFLRGVNNNKSIREIGFDGVDLFGGSVFTMLGPFFKNNHNLINIYIIGCDFGEEGCRLFALAIGSSTNKSLKELTLYSTNIGDEEMVDIITALSMHPHLQALNLYRNRLRENGCVALATLLQCSAKELQYLYISRNEINDESIEALIPALTNCSHLKELFLSYNHSISTRGWQNLSSILEAPSCNLEKLGIARNNVDDDAMAAFANALTNNHTLHSLNLTRNTSITNIGWQAFSNVLCNNSSVNATFLSNHTLQDVGRLSLDASRVLLPLLRLNRSRVDKKEVTMVKMLQNHDDFDMLPFFEWEFKVLPLALRWLERASEYEMPEDFDANIERRKLSTIYQFVRGMPLLYVETRLRKELEDIKVAESQLEEESIQCKQLLQERKESIMKRLGKQ